PRVVRDAQLRANGVVGFLAAKLGASSARRVWRAHLRASGRPARGTPAQRVVDGMTEGPSASTKIRCLVVMGVSGAGKSTLASALGARLGIRYVDADDYHSPENIQKMQRGEPLTDEDRKDW